MKTLQAILFFLIISVGLAAQDTTNFLDKYKISNEKEWKEKRMSYYLNLADFYSSDYSNYYKGIENMQDGNYDSAIVDFKRSMRIYKYDNGDWQSLNPQKNYHPFFFIGICNSLINNYDSTIYYLQKSIEVNPKFEDPYIELGKFYAINKEYEKGIYYCDLLLDINERSGIAHYLKALIYYFNNKSKLTKKELKLANMADPSYVFPYLLQGDINYKNNNNSAAIKAYSKAIEIDPELSVAFLKRGIALFRQRRFKLAIVDFKEGFKIDTTEYLFPYFIGYTNIIRKNYDEGIDAMSESIKIQLADEGEYLSASFRELELNDIILTLNKHKLSALEQGIGYTLLEMSFNYNPYHEYGSIVRYAKQNPNSVFGSRANNYLLFLYKGYSLTSSRPDSLTSADSSLIFVKMYAAELKEIQNKDEASIQILNSIIKAKPNYTAAYNLRGLVYKKKEEYSKALKDFEYAIQLYPDYYSAQVNRGEVYYDIEMYNQALNVFLTIMNDIYENPYIFNSIGECYNKLNKKDSALYYFSRTIEIAPKYHKAYNNRGKLYLKEEDYHKAFSDFNICVHLDDEIAEYYLNRAISNIELNKYEFAIYDLKDAIKANPGLAEAYDKLGWIYYLRGKYKKCIEYSNLAVQNNNELTSAMYNIALSFLCLGEFEKSHKLYIITARKNVRSGLKIDQKAIDDLDFLIETNIYKKEAQEILDSIRALENDTLKK